MGFEIVPTSDITHPDMYRAVSPGGPKLFPRCWWQLRCKMNTDGTFELMPWTNDEAIAAANSQGSPLGAAVGSFLAWRAKPMKETEMPRPLFDLLRCYVVHWLYAPGWVDACRTEWGLPPLGMDELVDPYCEQIENVETPDELRVMLESMLRDGLDCLSPPSREDFQPRMDSLPKGAFG